MTHTCADCGNTFTPARADAAYCSSACRQRAYRNRNAPSRNGSSSTTTRNAAAVTNPEGAPIDWDTIPGNQREKISRTVESIRKKIQSDFDTRLQAEAAEYRAQTDQALADYKAKLKAEAEAGRASRNAERERYKLGLESIRAKGIISLSDYKMIKSCLHPDSRASVSDEKLAAAFRLFNDPKIEMLLVKGAAAAGR